MDVFLVILVKWLWMWASQR